MAAITTCLITYFKVLGFFVLFIYYIVYKLDTTGQILMIFIYVTD